MDAQIPVWAVVLLVLSTLGVWLGALAWSLRMKRNQRQLADLASALQQIEARLALLETRIAGTSSDPAGLGESGQSGGFFANVAAAIMGIRSRLECLESTPKPGPSAATVFSVAAQPAPEPRSPPAGGPWTAEKVATAFVAFCKNNLVGGTADFESWLGELQCEGKAQVVQVSRPSEKDRVVGTAPTGVLLQWVVVCGTGAWLLPAVKNRQSFFDLGLFTAGTLTDIGPAKLRQLTPAELVEETGKGAVERCWRVVKEGEIPDLSQAPSRSASPRLPPAPKAGTPAPVHPETIPQAPTAILLPVSQPNPQPAETPLARSQTSLEQRPDVKRRSVPVPLVDPQIGRDKRPQTKSSANSAVKPARKQVTPDKRLAAKPLARPDSGDKAGATSRQASFAPVKPPTQAGPGAKAGQPLARPPGSAVVLVGGLGSRRQSPKRCPAPWPAASAGIRAGSLRKAHIAGGTTAPGSDGTPPEEPAGAVAPDGARGQPIDGTILKLIGLAFSDFCASQRFFPISGFLVQLRQRVPEVGLSECWRTTMDREGAFVDSNRNGCCRFWRVNAGGRDYLLPRPLVRTSFEELEGFELPWDGQISPQRLKGCLPAMLASNGPHRWIIVRTGVLSRQPTLQVATPPSGSQR